MLHSRVRASCTRDWPVCMHACTEVHSCTYVCMCVCFCMTCETYLPGMHVRFVCVKLVKSGYFGVHFVSQKGYLCRYMYVDIASESFVYMYVCIHAWITDIHAWVHMSAALTHTFNACVYACTHGIHPHAWILSLVLAWSRKKISSWYIGIHRHTQTHRSNAFLVFRMDNY
jgi:hypothetical protein